MSNKFSKRVINNRSNFDLLETYQVEEAIRLIIEKSVPPKFDETVDVSVKLGIDPKQTDQNVRMVVNLPHGTGRKTRVAVLARDAKAAEAKEAGADLVGAEELIEDIKSGKIDFDVLIATPDMMGILGGVAKILGPKGKMPRPQSGTVTMQVANAVKNAKFGQVESRNDKAGVISAGIGKISFGKEKLVENLRCFLANLEKMRPTTAKGVYFPSGRAYISSTMGVGLKFDVASFLKNKV